LARELHIPFVSNQSQYNMVWRIIEPEVVPTARELGISQIVYSPLYEGILTGKYLPGQPPPADSRAATGGINVFIKGKLDDDTLLERVQRLKPIATDEGLTMAQLALAWTLTNDNVASAITGASRPEQITASAPAADHVLSEETLARIDDVLSDSINRDGALVEQSSPKQR
jgi:aryl-alcohol dehydrogenase-like predicted oxidoreductase